MTSHTPEEWEKDNYEFIRRFLLHDYRNEEEVEVTIEAIYKRIRETRLASFNEGVKKALEVLPEETEELVWKEGVREISRRALNTGWNVYRTKAREAIQALITNQDTTV